MLAGSLHPKLDNLKYIMYAWHSNTMAEAENEKIPEKLKKIWYFLTFLETLLPKQADLMFLIYPWHKNTM